MATREVATLTAERHASCSMISRCAYNARENIRTPIPIKLLSKVPAIRIFVVGPQEKMKKKSLTKDDTATVCDVAY